MKNSPKDIVAFTIIYNRHKVHIYNYVLKMIYDKMMCEDIVQNVFLKFFENMENIRNQNSIICWLFTAARNEVFTYFRRKKIRVDQFNVGDVNEFEIISGDNPANELEQKDIKNIIYSELEKMAIDQREVYLLKEYGGLNYKEISDVMGIDENLVKSRLFKTRQKLIARLSKVLN